MELSHSFADVHYVSISLKRELLLYKQPLESRSKTLSTYFVCNTLTIVSARTRRIPQLAEIVLEITEASPSLVQYKGEESFTTRVKIVDFFG